MKSKEHKIVFNLSIKDLKELGILDKKKKKKKRRKNKYSKKKAYNNFGEGYRTENLSRGETINDATNLLKNQLVEQQLKAIQNGEDNRMVERNPHLAIENQLQNERVRNDLLHDQNRQVINHLYHQLENSRYDKPVPSQPSIYEPYYSPQMTKQNYANVDDNIDTASTGGSDTFQFGGSHPQVQEVQEIEKPMSIKEQLEKQLQEQEQLQELQSDDEKEQNIEEDDFKPLSVAAQQQPEEEEDTSTAFNNILSTLTRTKQANLKNRLDEYKQLLKQKGIVYDKKFDNEVEIKNITKEMKKIEKLPDAPQKTKQKRGITKTTIKSMINDEAQLASLLKEYKISDAEIFGLDEERLISYIYKVIKQNPQTGINEVIGSLKQGGI